jgi:hypothetical protein
MNKYRTALSIVENAKIFIEKAWPEDKELTNRIRDVLIRVCYKVYELERKSHDSKQISS